MNEQALISEMNKVLRRQYRKQLGGDQHIPEEMLAPDIAPPQPTVEDLGTTPQERDLLRMLLSYGHERIMVPFQNEDGNTAEEETSVAELMFELLALDDILFDEPIFREIYLDYRHTSNLGDRRGCPALRGPRTGSLAQHRHRPAHREARAEPQLEGAPQDPRETRKRDPLDALEEAVDILKERRVDRMIKRAAGTTAAPPTTWA